MTHPMRVFLALVLVMLTGYEALAADSPPLARARLAYNAADYETAIEAAKEARRLPGSADPASVVLARALLERYRTGGDPADLTEARDVLKGVARTRLTPRDQIELMVAQGLTLYCAEAFGPAAEVFDAALSRAALLPTAERGVLLEWWASSLEHEAQRLRTVSDRQPIFRRIRERMEQELRDTPSSPQATYWLVAAIRGAGDVDRAWNAAIAVWVRTSADIELARAVRGDIDRLVREAIIPERARLGAVRDQPEIEATLSAQWDAIKEQW